MSKRMWERWWEHGTSGDFPRRYVKKWKGEEIQWSNSPVRKIIQQEGLEGESVLDVGCATCIDYEYFKDTGVHYVGVDLTERYLTAARSLYPGIDVRQGNVTQGLPFSDKSFDMVYLKSVIEHLHPDEWRKAVGEIWRVARLKILLAFFIPPRDEEATYVYREEGFWNNRLDRRELLRHLEGLEGYGGVKMYENVTGNDLYVVYRDSK